MPSVRHFFLHVFFSTKARCFHGLDCAGRCDKAAHGSKLRSTLSVTSAWDEPQTAMGARPDLALNIPEITQNHGLVSHSFSQ